MMKKKQIMAVLTALTLAMGIIGCGSRKQEPAAEEQKQEETAPEEKTLGQKADGEDIIHFELENASGKDIKSFMARNTADGDFSTNELADGDLYKNGEKRQIYLKKSESTNNQDEREMNPEYEIKVTFTDDSSNVLHQVALDDIKDGRLMLEGDLSYLIYTSKQSAEQVVTKEAEQKIRDDATAREEEKTQKQDSATKSSSEQSSNQSVQETKPAPKPQEKTTAPKSAPKSAPAQKKAPASAPAQQKKPSSNAQKGCIDDGVFN